jgi:probable FeS assembly SUF system protein SufT
MKENEDITIKRDCEATQIPSGVKITLSAGTLVRLVQSLGGTFTVTTDQGYMARIEEKDADALGKEVGKPSQSLSSTAGSLEEQVWGQLKTCYDPEIPVNIVELGLIYGCEIIPLAQGSYKVGVKMTLTAQGCGMGQSIAEDAKRKIQNLLGVKECEVEVVWDPPWNPSMMSSTAKRQLRLEE